MEAALGGHSLWRAARAWRPVAGPLQDSFISSLASLFYFLIYFPHLLEQGWLSIRPTGALCPLLNRCPSVSFQDAFAF